jgi:hypothetical protein
MNPKPRPNRRRQIEILRRMTPGERLAKAFELGELTTELFLAGLRSRYPALTEAEVRRLAVQIRMRRWRRQ